MSIRNIDNLASGMTLASDLLGANGRFLLPKGTVLEDKHVTEADVAGEDAAEPGSETHSDDSPAHVEDQAHKWAAWLFRRANLDLEPMREIHRLSLQALAAASAAGVLAPVCIVSPSGEPAPLPNLGDMPASAADLASREVQLASFPDIYFQIVDVLNSPNSSAIHAADVVSKDTSLTARLLRLVNSPFYGFPSRIDSISRAVTLVGSNELSMLALGVSVVQHFQDIPAERIDMKAFWKHSIATGVFARLLAVHKLGLTEERFFLGGLIHDIGRLIMLRNYPLAARHVLDIALHYDVALCEAERQVMGFDHADAAGCILTQWTFPLCLEEMVRYHHQPDSSQNQLDAAIVHLADILAHALIYERGDPAGVPALSPQAWKVLDMPVSLLASVVRQAQHLIGDIFQAFLGSRSTG